MNLGERIRLARIRAEMSMRELGEKAGVSATAISKFENGQAQPRQSTLLRLAKALSVEVEYFFRDVKIEMLRPAYRQRSSKWGKKAQEALEARLVETLERYMLIDEILPPSKELPEFPRFKVRTLDDIESAAENLRLMWNLGTDPIDPLVSRLEDCGIVVIGTNGPDAFDGFSCWLDTAKSRPVIAFNVGLPGDRQRLTIAHELGHLVLEIHGDLDEEKAAFRFAGAFLIPRQTAYSELGERRSNLDLTELLLLKEEYGVSVQAWVRRAFDLGIIDEATHTRLQKHISARGWRKDEPCPIKPELPQRFALKVRQALAESLITPSQAMVLLGERPSGEARLRSYDSLSRSAENLAPVYATDRDLTELTDAEWGDDDAHS